MKKIALMLLLFCCFFAKTAFAESLILEYDGGVHNYTGDVYKLVVNGRTLTDLPLNPIFFNERAVVPVREVFEALGATVDYSYRENTVTINYKSNTVVLEIGTVDAIINGEKKTIPDGVGTKIIGKWGEEQKTMVPLRFIAESMGLVVDFDWAGKTIGVSDKTVKPTATQPPVETQETPRLRKLTYDVGDDGVVTIQITTTAKINKMSKAIKTASGTIYVDIFGAKNELATKTPINSNGVNQVRIGEHEDYTRVAVDTEEIYKYEAFLSESQKVVTLKFSTDPHVVFEEPEVQATPAPEQTPDASGDTTVPVFSGYDERKIVVIDPGHGGKDPGTLAKLQSGEQIYEKTIAFSVAEKVKKILEENGITVVMTRDGDYYPSLDERVAITKSCGAVLFVSIHLNSSTAKVTSTKGIEVYYCSENNDHKLGTSSEALATEILNNTIRLTSATSRGVKNGNLMVTRENNIPAALIEIGFMNNIKELAMMVEDSYQDKLATGIATGIINTYKRVVIPEEQVR